MKDYFKYPLISIYFYITDGCNLACRHCWIEPVYNSENFRSLSVDLFKKIIDEAKPLGLKGVKLTGGEPLLHPQIKEILRIIKESNLRLVIETNGILCSPDMVRVIKDASENVFISVSLDGAYPETHEWLRGVKGSFSGAIEGIKNLVKEGIRPQIIMTLIRRNKEEIKDLIVLAEELGASSIKFNVMQPHARAKKLYEQGEALSVEELIEIGKKIESGEIKSKKLWLFFHQPMAFRPLRNMFGRDGRGCGVCMIKNIIGVLSDGSYSICGIGETIPELIFGNAEIHNLEDIWYNASLLNEIREGLPNRLEGVCQKCLMKFMCMGKCIAQNYSFSGSFWSPFWFCKEAFEKGLFPQERLLP
ncbi:MAG: SynChlorMet cassette radical SAM/SPASM protein ScmF [Candidatus Omnitrophica bacterium]|nr:SynChlorMet cassette radical SAM/SPASM protein ScmF [Candidatus Omnitrophota bacterium]